ncbi:MAG: hypothetical protein J3K34DRAFT_520198 [Monoraphidium minutum]|nr:MAG: hypothetical protein J3K34DRAFT_520198 [Monoraphidium minutum]
MEGAGAAEGVRRDLDVDSRLDPTLTFAFDKLSCVRGMFFAHVLFSYLVAFTGFACLVTRLWARLHGAHMWLGRAYIIFMLWATATSLLIHNTGLPISVLWSFVWVLGGLTIGWVAISVHQSLTARKAIAAAAAAIKAEGGAVPGGDLAALIGREKARIADERSVLRRVLSLKALHGAVMFVSWINIAGRVFATGFSEDFTCHTYRERAAQQRPPRRAAPPAAPRPASPRLAQPLWRVLALRRGPLGCRTPARPLNQPPRARRPTSPCQPRAAAVYKQIDTDDFKGAGQPITPVPARNPHYARQPWARLGPMRWGLVMLFGPLIGALLFGTAFAAAAATVHWRRLDF